MIEKTALKVIEKNNVSPLFVIEHRQEWCVLHSFCCDVYLFYFQPFPAKKVEV